MLQLENINCKIDEYEYLKNINYTFKGGTITTIAGHSGIGKSLLFSIMAGVKSPDSGDIFFKEKSIFNSSFKTLQDLRKRFGIAFQVPAIISNLSLRDNLRLTLKSDQEIIENSKEFELAQYLDLRPSSLSQGQLYRLALCRAFISNPEIFLWDEPIINIDDFFYPVIDKKIANLKAQGRAIIFFSNRKSIIEKYGEDKLILQARKLDRYEL